MREKSLVVLAVAALALSPLPGFAECHEKANGSQALVPANLVTQVNVIAQRVPGAAGADTQKELLAAAPAVPDFSPQDPPPLLWKNRRHPERDQWTKYTYDVVSSVFDQLDQVRDMRTFCPNYPKLTRDRKIETWAMLFSEISFWESSFDPTNDTLETGPSAGTDDVTGGPVHSDGLLQLSYQDGIVDTNPADQEGVANAGQYCHFDWKADQKLAKKDVHRTIYNPYNNLYCGIHIMAVQIATPPHKIVLGGSAYWSTLQKGNPLENRVREMAHQMGRYKFCGGHNGPLGELRYGIMRGIRSLDPTH